MSGKTSTFQRSCMIVVSTLSSPGPFLVSFLMRSKTSYNYCNYYINLYYNDFQDFPQGRTRNDSERRAGKLFNFIDGSEMPGGIQGNPEYLAELITLSDESLRDTIFFNVFKRQLLFDNLETAIQYRQWMVKKRKSVPTIYTRTGEKLTQEGQLDPGINIIII